MVSRRQLIGRMSAAAIAAPVAALAQDSPGSGGGLAGKLPGIMLAAGRHVVGANLIVRADVMVMPGATIEVAAGRTLTLLGDFQAPIGHVFTGPGRVDMNASRAVAAHPEWWGAARNDSSRDSLPALRACVAAHPVTLLGAADYFIGDTWKIDIPHRRIWGAGKNWGGPNDATRIIVVSADKDVMQLGFDKAPGGGMNSYLQSVDLRWMELARSAAPRARDGTSAAGLRVRYTLDCLIEGISADEHTVGFSCVGAVYTHLRDCRAFRSIAGDRGGSQHFWGFHLDGRASIGLSGGNASLYLNDCGAAIGGSPGLSESIGVFLQGGFADTFIQNFETSAIAVGVKVDGMADVIGADFARSGHGNLHLLMPILDQTAAASIEITNVSAYAAIDIVDPYLGPSPTALAAIFIHRSKGLVTINGGQAIGWYNNVHGGNALGVYGQDADGIGIHGLKLIGFRRPVSYENCQDFTIDAMINNPGEKAVQAAISLLNCGHGQVRSRIKGRADAFPAGIDLRGGNHHLSIDIAAIDAACLTGGPAATVVGARDNAGMRPASIAVIGTIA